MTPEGADRTRRLLELLGGKARSQAVSTAAALGLPERLRDAPRTPSELARELGSSPRALASLLDFLVGLELLAVEPPDRYRLTELGRELGDDRLGPLATFVGAPEQWDPWARLRDALADGGPCAFERTHGRELYAHIEADDAAARRYDAAIDAFTRAEARALCRAFDFGAVRRVLDVGGGPGTLLRALLEHAPHLRGTLLERERVALRARAEPHERLDVVAGDYLDAVPAGADVILLKHVLHNLDDDGAVHVLARCARALAGAGDGKSRGRVLVVEALVLPGVFDQARVLDLEMLVLCGTRERKKSELRALFTRAGLRLADVRALTPTGWLLIGEPTSSTRPA